MDLKQNRVDTKRANEGVWVELDDARFLIAHWMNDKQRKFIAKSMEPHQRGRKGKNISEDVAEKILIESVARFVLLSWENLQDAGEDVAYSVDTATTLLSDRELRWLYEWVAGQAQDIDNFIQDTLEEELEAVGKP